MEKIVASTMDDPFAGPSTAAQEADLDSSQQAKALHDRPVAHPRREERLEESGGKRLDVRPVLVVGIGGTGCLAVKHLKRRVLEITRNTPVPFIRYIVFDTTVEDPAIIKLDEGEFVNIGQLDLNEIVQNIADYPHLKAWFPYDKFKPMQLGLGAMGVRHIGRLCYFQWRESPKVRDLVMNRLQELMSPSLPDRVWEVGDITDLRIEQGTGIDIHVIGSGSGGTGSGCFLDLAYDLRNWAKSVAKSTRVIGHLLLPDAFEGLVPEPVMPQAESNSFALLSELDHFIGNGGWDVCYKSERVVSRETPFDLIYLLGRNGVDGAARTRSELVAMAGNVIASLVLTAVGKDLMDCAVNLIPPILSGTDEHHKKPCPYASYGISIGVADRYEILREGTVALSRRVLETIIGRNPASYTRMTSRVDSFLADIPLATEELERLCPETPQFNTVGQPTSVADADIFRENQHAPKLQEQAAVQKKMWKPTLEGRFATASGSRLLAELKHLFTSRRESESEREQELRLGELVDFSRCLAESFKKIVIWCDRRLEGLNQAAELASSQLQELRLSHFPPDGWMKRYAEFVREEDARTVQADYFNHVRELALQASRSILGGIHRHLDALHELLSTLRTRVDERSPEIAEFQVPFSRFVTSKEALGGLYKRISGPARSFRRVVADLIESQSLAGEEALDSLDAALSEISRQAVDATLSNYSLEDRLNVHRIARDLKRFEPDRFALKLKNMYSLAQPAFRARERYPKEKIVSMARLNCDPADPALRFVRGMDGTVQGLAEDPWNMILVRFLYGLPLWAIEGIERWERTALGLQARMETLHNYLDPTWAEQVESIIPKPVELRETLWFFSMWVALGRIQKPVETYEIAGERLRGVKTRAAAFAAFEQRLRDGRIARAEAEDAVENYLGRLGDHAAQLQALEKHLKGLQERLVKEHDSSGSREDVHLLRDEILVVKEHIIRKQKDL
jgi:hypothetical protein